MDVVMELFQNTMYVSSLNTQSIQCNRAEGAKCAPSGESEFSRKGYDSPSMYALYLLRGV